MVGEGAWPAGGSLTDGGVSRPEAGGGARQLGVAAGRVLPGHDSAALCWPAAWDSGEGVRSSPPRRFGCCPPRNSALSRPPRRSWGARGSPWAPGPFCLASVGALGRVRTPGEGGTLAPLAAGP